MAGVANIGGVWYVLLARGEVERCRSEVEARGVAAARNAYFGERDLTDLLDANRLLRQAGRHPDECFIMRAVQSELRDLGQTSDIDPR
jgi:hypothetical protein